MKFNFKAALIGFGMIALIGVYAFGLDLIISTVVKNYGKGVGHVVEIGGLGLIYATIFGLILRGRNV